MSAWLDADWPTPPRVRALTTTRFGMGVSQPPFEAFDLGLRNGDDVATIANEGWNASQAGAAADARSPRATNNRRRGFLGWFCNGRRNRR